MYTGTKPVDELAEGAPVMPSLDGEPLTLEGVEIVTAVYEADASVNEAVLPPGLHPTIPPIVSFTVWSCPSSPVGAFRLAQTRVGCRSGMRPRAFLVSAVVDSPAAGALLAERWGYRCRTGEVGMRRLYDRVVVSSSVDGASVLELEAVDPTSLRPGDVQWIAGMHLANTPRGLRLVQVDPDYDVRRAERARPQLHGFAAAAWGEALLRPRWPVAASVAVADVTLPRLRYLCAPDRFALGATEVLEGSTA